MTAPHDPNVTADLPVSSDPTVTVDSPASSLPPDSLDAGLAAGFGRRAGSPRAAFASTVMRPVLLKDAEGESAHIVKPKSDAMPPKEETGDRYQLSGEIARGGMGAVLRGRDVDLGRDLAVKVLLDKYANRPEVARRFIEEAQIGGQLQHPGVVPVYDIGRFGDRPFFTMKLVKGQTLAAILEERADATADRPRLLGIALKVSETLAYAHAKGVIHRDLKPSNVMVGAFGEVQVMDWGLAKVLSEGGVADEERASRALHEPEDVTTIRTARSSGSTGNFGTDTEAGSIMGTPAYMPPEQANGDIANLDRRADVFGLGAILCEILTGKPPYVGRSSEEVRRKAANGDLADATARLDGCGADAELIALTKTCLCPEAIDRPRDAQEVTDELSAYLNGVQERLQTAERERAVAVVREAEQRQKRKVQLALAASVVGLMLGGGAFAFWRAEQAQAGRERDARNAEAVASLLGQAEESLKTGDTAKARVALEAARKRSAEGGAEKDADRLKRLEADLELLRELDDVDQVRWTWVEDHFPQAEDMASRTREVLKRFGADPEVASVYAIAARVDASVVKPRLIAAMDRVLRYQKPAGLREVLRRLDSHEYRDEVRDAVLADDVEKFAALVDRDAALAQPAGFAAFLAESPTIAVERKRQLLKAALIWHPENIHLLMTLAETYSAQQTEEAVEKVRWYQAAIAADPENIAALNNLGVSLKQTGDQDGAIACIRRSIELDPKFAMGHINLFQTLLERGDLAGALASARKHIELDPKEGAALFHQGLVLGRQGDVNGAVESYRRAVEIDPKLAQAHNNLGHLLKEKGDLDGAIASFRRTIEIDPMEVQGHLNLALSLEAKGDRDGAVASYRTVIDIDPNKTQALNNLGVILREKGDVDGGIVLLRRAIELDPKHAFAHFNLGVALKAKGDVDGAIAHYRTAAELDPAILDAHYNLAVEMYRRGRWDDAVDGYKKVVELNPNDAEALTNLGDVLCNRKQDFERGIPYLRRAVTSAPRDARAFNVLGTALAGKGELDEALTSFTKATELQPRYVAAHLGRGNVLMSKGDSDGAIASFHKVLEFDPGDAIAHCNLGQALSQKGRFAESLTAFKRGHELGMKQPGWRYPSAAWVRQAETKAALEAKLPAFLTGEFTPGNTQEHLALAAICQTKKVNHAAARLYAAAIATDPKLADDLSSAHRYNAACTAALAADGRGEDAVKLDDAERLRLRTQARDMLRADLTALGKLLDTGSPLARQFIAQVLSHWQKNNELASIRDQASLAKLPADEQKAFAQLWADVAAVLAKAEGNPAEKKPTPAPPPPEKK